MMLDMRILRRMWPGLWRDLLLNTLFASALVPVPLRTRLLRLYGLKIGRGVFVSPTVWFGSKRVSIGDRSFVNYGCRFNTTAPIVIGADCAVGMDVVFATDSHELGGHDRRAGAGTAAPITVGSGVWIGARAVLLQGVTVGDGAVIAAGAVVVRDCPADGLYAGVPAALVRSLHP